MYSSTIYSVITAALISFAGAQNTTLPVTGELGNATVVKDNPVGVVYKAFLPPKQNTPLDGQLSAVKGLISATAGHHGVGVEFSFEISGLPTSGGPFRKFPSSGEGMSAHVIPSLPYSCRPCPRRWKLHEDLSPSWPLHPRRGELGSIYSSQTHLTIFLDPRMWPYITWDLPSRWPERKAWQDYLRPLHGFLHGQIRKHERRHRSFLRQPLNRRSLCQQDSNLLRQLPPRRNLKWNIAQFHSPYHFQWWVVEDRYLDSGSVGRPRRTRYDTLIVYNDWNTMEIGRNGVLSLLPLLPGRSDLLWIR